ncbi:protein 33 kDa [Simian adenovirus DM-2014]|uniref:Protein 33 kDa n=1 Tax=Simian adenovirus DM-2014 TaxID=1560346 RepID=A0A097IWD0_9ADEN|nr:protein 33 kDa [Simian adenovirus DM-2014]AIT70987.1 protein 33 kDa [Simian adenovirus DM-2014]
MPAKKRTALPPTSTQRLKQRKQEKHWSAEESDWESQGDMEEEWDSLASDEGEAEAETEDTVAKPSQKRPSNATTSSDQPTINRRWDNTAAAAMGKTTLKKSRQGYRSWRKHKNAIITCLENCGGNISLPQQAKKQDSPSTKELRNRIFPTLYAIFQQSRGQEPELKIKNRSLRSLTRSCLYHKNEEQLQRTLDDAEALFNKYCASTLKE